MCNNHLFIKCIIPICLMVVYSAQVNGYWGSSSNSCWRDGSTTKPHESDCSSYYLCRYGNIVLRSCLKGQHWCAARQRCESPTTAGCQKGSQQQQQQGGGGAKKGSDGTQQGGNDIIVTDRRCSMDIPGYPVTFQNQQDCSTYYTCNQGKPVLTGCPRGLNYNPQRGGCDDSVPSGCRRRPVPRPPPSTPIFE